MSRVAVVLGVVFVISCNRPPVAPVTSATRAVTVSDVTIGGLPPPEQFADDLATHTSAVVELAEACYAERRETRPELGGDHRLLVYVSAAEVIRVTTEESTLDDDVLEDCVKQALLRYELPPDMPRGGVYVRFLIVFTPPVGR